MTPFKSEGLKYPTRENKELNFSLKKGNLKKIQVVHKNWTVTPLELPSWIIPGKLTKTDTNRWVHVQREREKKGEKKFRKILQIPKYFSFPNSLFPDFIKTFTDNHRQLISRIKLWFCDLWSPLLQICAYLPAFPNEAEDSAANLRTLIKLKFLSKSLRVGEFTSDLFLQKILCTTDLRYFHMKYPF